MSVVLETRGLARSFGAVPATVDLDLEVRSHEIHAVIGPNGAGKTTLVGLLSGELRPDSGRIFFEARDVTDLPVHRRAHLGIARTFQVSSVLPSFSVLHNVAVAVQATSGTSFRFLADASRERRLNEPAEAILERLGLTALADRPALALSHGERRVLELAIALALRPKLLLLDEPLAGLGPGEAAAILGILEELRRETAILLIEHDMDAVFRLADRITVLVYGRAIASGPPASIRSDPEVRAAYLGDEDVGG
jgi:branched-chain amino acid transport system ATP-binding protein